MTDDYNACAGNANAANPYDGKVAQIVPQNVEKLPLFHWHPGARLLCVGSRDGASFTGDYQAAEKNTFLRALSPELLQLSQEKMQTDGICATLSANLSYPRNLRLLCDSSQAVDGSFALVTAGYGDPQVLEEIHAALDAVVVLMGPQSGPLSSTLLQLDCHIEVLWGIDTHQASWEQMAAVDWTGVSAVHLSSLRPHGAQVEERAAWYALAQQHLPAEMALYDDDHNHSHCRCGETLVWRSGGRSRRDQLGADQCCMACGHRSKITC